MYPTEYWINKISGRLLKTSSPDQKRRNMSHADQWERLEKEQYEMIVRAIRFYGGEFVQLTIV